MSLFLSYDYTTCELPNPRVYATRAFFRLCIFLRLIVYVSQIERDRECVCVCHTELRAVSTTERLLSLLLSRPGILPRLSISMAERTPKRTIDSTEVDVSLRRLRHSADVSTNKTAGGVQSGRQQRKRRELEIMLYH